jgi:hypothetical protein
MTQKLKYPKKSFGDALVKAGCDEKPLEWLQSQRLTPREWNPLATPLSPRGKGSFEPSRRRRQTIRWRRRRFYLLRLSK